MRQKIGKSTHLFFKNSFRFKIPHGCFLINNYDFQQVICVHLGANPLFLLNQGYFSYLCTPVDFSRY
jgi:hypothetical protein